MTRSRSFHRLSRFNAVLLCAVALCGGCAKATPPVSTLQEAHQKLVTILTDEIGRSAVIMPSGTTLYIYVPVDMELVEQRATRRDPSGSGRPASKEQLNTVDVRRTDAGVAIDYDISPVTVYPKSPGYVSTTPEAVARLNQNILAAINRAYGDLAGNTDAIRFVVVLLVNTRTGFGVRTLFYLPDLRLSIAGILPQEEAARRMMSEFFGEEKMIGDRLGRSIDAREITWDEFLARQIRYRIEFAYTRSDFPPTGTPEETMRRIAEEAFAAYPTIERPKITVTSLSGQ